MEYNKKEELLNKIEWFKKDNTDIKSDWYNKGLEDTLEYTEYFFDKELVPEVPQYVANWYESHKEELDYYIWYTIASKDLIVEEGKKINDWIEDTEDAIIILVKMHLFGYTVKKTDLYTVKLINGGQYLYTETKGNTYFTCVDKSVYTKEKLSDLGFDWVFNCQGIELEEVEE